MSTDPQSCCGWQVASALIALRAVGPACDRALGGFPLLRERLEDLQASAAGERIHRRRPATSGASVALAAILLILI
jgi:hypothetical protein